eukprot:gene33791-51456_t
MLRAAAGRCREWGDPSWYDAAPAAAALALPPRGGGDDAPRCRVGEPCAGGDLCSRDWRLLPERARPRCARGLPVMMSNVAALSH